MITPWSVRDDDKLNNPPSVDSHGPIPVAKRVTCRTGNGGWYTQIVGAWTSQNLEQNNLKMFAIFADYGRDEAHRNKHPYYFIAPNRMLAVQRFRQKFSWLKPYNIMVVTEPMIIDKVLKDLNYTR